MIEFEIKGLPKTTNFGGRAHWAVKIKEANHWKKLVWLSVCSQKPKEPLNKAKLTLTRCSSSEPDFDGLVSSFKHVLDGLKESKIIIDDKPSVIGSPTYLWMKVSPKAGRIKVKVEEE